MNKLACWGLVALAGVLQVPVVAGELKSGPAVGDQVDAFDVTKWAGADADGVTPGQTLCYR